MADPRAPGPADTTAPVRPVLSGEDPIDHEGPTTRTDRHHRPREHASTT
jgi:hypothetical protein